MDERYFTAIAARFVRGRCPDAPASLSDDDLVSWGLDHGLRLHKFKRTMGLPRVARVLGALQQLQPTTLIDVGSGRGAFLWPLLDTFPDLLVECWEVDEQRFADLDALHRGGLSRLTARHGDLALAAAPEPADVVTVLEVLEHVEDPEPLARGCVASATAAVIASVPSHEDDNPGHVRVFSRDDLVSLFTGAGASRVAVDQVRGHLVAVCTGLTPQP